jgi:hypothetical protein
VIPFISKSKIKNEIKTEIYKKSKERLMHIIDSLCIWDGEKKCHNPIKETEDFEGTCTFMFPKLVMATSVFIALSFFTHGSQNRLHNRIYKNLKKEKLLLRSWDINIIFNV